MGNLLLKYWNIVFSIGPPVGALHLPAVIFSKSMLSNIAVEDEDTFEMKLFRLQEFSELFPSFPSLLLFFVCLFFSLLMETFVIVFPFGWNQTIFEFAFLLLILFWSVEQSFGFDYLSKWNGHFQLSNFAFLWIDGCFFCKKLGKSKTMHWGAEFGAKLNCDKIFY